MFVFHRFEGKKSFCTIRELNFTSPEVIQYRNHFETSIKPKDWGYRRCHMGRCGPETKIPLSVRILPEQVTHVSNHDGNGCRGLSGEGVPLIPRNNLRELTRRKYINYTRSVIALHTIIIIDETKCYTRWRAINCLITWLSQLFC